MNAVGFLNNLDLAGQALKDYSFTGETRFNLALQIALKCEEIELQNRETTLKEEQIRQEMELKALEAKNKYDNASAELIKSIVQAKSMVKSVWDNANINKCNALVGLFNVVMNAQNASNLSTWQEVFNEIKNAIYAIGQNEDIKGNENELIDEIYPLIDKITADLDKLIFSNNNLKQVALICPKYEILINEPVLLRGVSIFNQGENGFIIKELTTQATIKEKTDETDKAEITQEILNQNNYLFKSDKAGEFKITYYATNDKNEKISDTIKIKVVKPLEIQKN